MNFGILVKRKTFLKGLVLVLACTLMFFIYNQQVTASTIQETQVANELLTW